MMSRYIRLPLLCAAALITSVALAQTPTISKSLLIGERFEVIVIDEVPGREMDIALFDGPLTAQERLKFMPNGKAPAAVNVILIKVDGKTYLVDTGFGNAIKVGIIDPSTIDAVLLTHEHRDHIGGLLDENDKPLFTAPIFVAQKERDYWHDAQTPNSDLQKKTATIYGNQYKTFDLDDLLYPGIVAIDAAGHTPGHTAFLVGIGKQKLLIAADFLHAAALQFPNPDESASFDVDKKAAAAARKKLMQMAADQGWLIAGTHIPVGYGSVKSDGKGGFVFAPGE